MFLFIFLSCVLMFFNVSLVYFLSQFIDISNSQDENNCFVYVIPLVFLHHKLIGLTSEASKEKAGLRTESSESGEGEEPLMVRWRGERAEGNGLSYSNHIATY